MDEHDPLLSQTYRQVDHPEPPAALDAAILRAARQAVVKPAPRRRSWRLWALPAASTTAVLVLAVTLVLKVQREAPQQLSFEPAPVMPTPAEKVSPSPAADAVTAPVPRPSPKSPPRPGTDAAKAIRSADLPAPAPATAASVPAESGAATSPAAPSPSPASRDAAFNAGSEAANRALPAPAAQALGRLRAPAAEQRLDLRKAMEAPASHDTPEKGVERVRRLLREGREEEARQVLTELVRRYPAYEIPEDLRGLREALPR